MSWRRGSVGVRQVVTGPQVRRRGWLLGIMAAAGVLLGSASAWAVPTTANDAQTIVQNWLGMDAAPLGATVGSTVNRVETFNDAQGQAQYYVVYLNPSGFVIVSADDGVEPIIAFSPSGTYERTTSNPLAALVESDVPNRMAVVRTSAASMRAMATTLSAAQGTRAPALAPGDKWALLRGQSATSNLPAGTSSLQSAMQPSMSQATSSGEIALYTISDIRVPPLVQTAWDQGDVGDSHCYNYYTPNHYWCGCVATATAQLIFYGHSVYGQPASTFSIGTQSFQIHVDDNAQAATTRGGDGAGGPYAWDNMPLDPANTSGLTEAQRQAIGAFCYDVGVVMHMSYHADGSGAADYDAKSALKDVFGYGNAVLGVNPSGGLSSSLQTMLNPNLDAGYPCLLTISKEDMSHEVVADGYGYNMHTPYHHVNLGWGGAYTVWYNLPEMNLGVNGYYKNVYSCVYNAFPVSAGEIISGRVLDNAGCPIADVAVTACRDGGGTYNATTNANGIYALAGIPSGSTYTISAAKPGTSCAFDQRTVSTGTSVDYGAVGNCWGVDLVDTTPFPPTAESASITAIANETTDVTLMAFDQGVQNPTGLTYTILSLPSNGTLTDPNGQTITTVPYTVLGNGYQVVYTPATDFTGSDAFTFKANDGGDSPTGGDSSIATISISVMRALVLSDAAVTLGGSNPLYSHDGSILADLGKGSVVVLPKVAYNRTTEFPGDYAVIVSPPTHGHLVDLNTLSTVPNVPCTITSGLVGYVMTSDFDHPDSFLMKECEVDNPSSSGESNVATITICAQPPTASGNMQPLPAYRGFPVTVELVGSDDGVPNPLAFTITSLPVHGSLQDPNGGLITQSVLPYTLNQNGNKVIYTTWEDLNIPMYGCVPDSFEFKVNDGGHPPLGGDSNTAAVTIWIQQTTPLTAEDANVSILGGRPNDIELHAGYDYISGRPCPPTTSLIITSLPSHGTLRDPNAGDITNVPYTLVNGGIHVTYASVRQFEGADSFTFKANDGGQPPTGGDSNVATISLMVTQAPPVATDVSVDLYSGGTVTVQLAATDDGLPNPPGILTYTITSLPFFGTLVDPNGTTITAVPYSLIGHGSQVVYQPSKDIVYDGDPVYDSFWFKANDADGAQPVNGGDSNVASVRINRNATPYFLSVDPETVGSGSSTITVQFTDDGRPDPLICIVTQLPLHGSLADPNAGLITSTMLPYSLVNHGNQVVYTPVEGFAGTDTFVVRGSDGDRYTDASVSLTVLKTLYTANMDTNPGWTLQGLWAWGQPTGQGSGNHDPLSGYTGTNVLGYNLNGDYENGLPGPVYATTPAIDCRGCALTKLCFRQWLGVQAHDCASVQVSNDGVTWYNVYTHSDAAAAVADQGWTLKQYDISDYADEQQTVYIRWGIGPTNNDGLTGPGWNIDDVQVTGIPMSAPVALDGTATFQAGQSVTITLQATDVGPATMFGYRIMSLPSHGSLSKADGTSITIPQTWLGASNVVIYTPASGYMGSDSFTFMANDGGYPPTGGNSNVATIYLNPPVILSATGPAFAYEGWTVALGCSATSPSNYPLSYQWTQMSGKAVTLNGADTATPSFVVPTLTFRNDGPLVFHVAVADGYGGSAVSGNVTINVYMMGDITHDGFVNVGDNQALVAKWGVGPGYTGPEDLNGDGFVNIGDLQLLNPNWGRSLGAVAVTVSTVPSFVYEGQQVSLTCSGASAYGYDLSYSWTQTSGLPLTLSGADTNNASFTVPTLAYTADRPLVFHVVVSDGHGGSASANVTVQAYMMGDINGDGFVNVGDTQKINAAMGSTPGSTNWNAKADLNNDGVVDSADQTLLTANNGRTLASSITLTVGDVPAFVYEGWGVNLACTATSARGYPLTYRWTQTYGPTASYTGGNTAGIHLTVPTLVSVDDEWLGFTVTVTDGHGGTVTSDDIWVDAFMLGDVNHDYVVDDNDTAAVTAAMNSAPGDANWNAAADLNNDGTVSSADQQIVTNNLGRSQQ